MPTRWLFAGRRGAAAIVAAGSLFVAGCAPSPEIRAESTATSVPSATPTAFPPAPSATATAAPACPEGTWIDFTYRGVAVNQDVPARVYLPPCYAAEGDIDYPTAYFLHGKPYTETQWTDLGLPGLVAEAADAGTFPPMILVLARQPEPLFSGSDGGPGSYETEFLDGLMAAVDANFATMEGPQGRAVIGLSRGGVWALEIALRHPEAIRYVVALSPALAVNLARPAYDPFALAAEGDARATRFLLAAGEEDWARAKTELFATTVAPRAAAAEVVLVPGSHTDSTWQALLPTVLAFLAQAFGAAALDGG